LKERKVVPIKVNQSFVGTSHQTKGERKKKKNERITCSSSIQMRSAGHAPIESFDSGSGGNFLKEFAIPLLNRVS
jgi:hypothetical protein